MYAPVFVNTPPWYGPMAPGLGPSIRPRKTTSSIPISLYAFSCPANIGFKTCKDYEPYQPLPCPGEGCARRWSLYMYIDVKS